MIHGPLARVVAMAMARAWTEAEALRPAAIYAKAWPKNARKFKTRGFRSAYLNFLFCSGSPPCHFLLQLQHPASEARSRPAPVGSPCLFVDSYTSSHTLPVPVFSFSLQFSYFQFAGHAFDSPESEFDSQSEDESSPGSISFAVQGGNVPNRKWPRK